MKNTIKGIDGLKGIWIIMIVVCHYTSMWSGFYGIGIPAFFSNGHFAACGFFVLSGFLIYMRHGEEYINSANPKTCILYWFRNVRKLLFFNVLGVLPYAVQFIVQRQGISKLMALRILSNFLMMQSWLPGKDFSLNPVSWFLSVLMFCYLLAPLYIRLYGMISKKCGIVIPIIMLAAGSFFLVFMIKTPYWYKSVLYHPMMFAMGIAAADVMRRIKLKSKYKLWPLSLIFLAAGYFMPGSNYSYLVDVWAAILLVSCLYVSADMFVFSGKPAVTVGKASLAVMMLHPIPIMFMSPGLLDLYFAGKPVYGFLILFLFMITSAGIAVLLFYGKNRILRRNK